MTDEKQNAHSVDKLHTVFRLLAKRKLWNKRQMQSTDRIFTSHGVLVFWIQRKPFFSLCDEADLKSNSNFISSKHDKVKRSKSCPLLYYS